MWLEDSFSLSSFMSDEDLKDFDPQKDLLLTPPRSPLHPFNSFPSSQDRVPYLGASFKGYFKEEPSFELDIKEPMSNMESLCSFSNNIIGEDCPSVPPSAPPSLGEWPESSTYSFTTESGMNSDLDIWGADVVGNLCNELGGPPRQEGYGGIACEEWGDSLWELLPVHFNEDSNNSIRPYTPEEETGECKETCDRKDALQILRLEHDYCCDSNSSSFSVSSSTGCSREADEEIDVVGLTDNNLDTPLTCMPLKRGPKGGATSRRGRAPGAKRLGRPPKHVVGGTCTHRTTRKHDMDDPYKRDLHNHMERLRRVDLKRCFHDLKVLIPDLQKRNRAPKVEILRAAALYCRSLTRMAKETSGEKALQLRHRDDLLRKLHSLSDGSTRDLR